MKIHSIRLSPGNDLKHSLDTFAADNKLDAAAIVTCVGSLTVASIRFAGKEQTDSVPGPLEITSLTGTFSTHGSHFHITVTDQNGKASGGHLKEGAIVRTTAEIVILEPEDVIFMRETDTQTGYKELKIVPK
ncbi:MAG: DNA-binding protein [Bacteroidetes bacterium]|nr:DNA-binding protein [Bacteroidota bacterium]